MLLLLLIVLLLIAFGGLGVGYRGGYYDANGLSLGTIVLVVLVVVLLFGGYHRNW